MNIKTKQKRNSTALMM